MSYGTGCKVTREVNSRIRGVIRLGVFAAVGVLPLLFSCENPITPNTDNSAVRKPAGGASGKVSGAQFAAAPEGSSPRLKVNTTQNPDGSVTIVTVKPNEYTLTTRKFEGGF